MLARLKALMKFNIVAWSGQLSTLGPHFGLEITLSLTIYPFIKQWTPNSQQQNIVKALKYHFVLSELRILRLEKKKILGFYFGLEMILS